MKHEPVTIYTLDGLLQVAKVQDGVAYDQQDNPIDPKLFGSTKHMVLQLEGEFEISTPSIPHTQMMIYRSQALDRIKNSPEAWELFKNPALQL